MLIIFSLGRGSPNQRKKRIQPFPFPSKYVEDELVYRLSQSLLIMVLNPCGIILLFSLADIHLAYEVRVGKLFR